ncbi:MAG: hypothetical protein ACRC7O_08650, partial [Fimbriiglobus sp.]
AGPATMLPVQHPTPRPGAAVTPDLNVLALFKGQERFIFVYDDASRDDVIASVRDAAANPAVGLNWFDAAVLTERARLQAADVPDSPDAQTIPRLPSPRV